jgi:ribonuclease D
MRENTYWPELCLVQIANEEEAAAVDPLAPGIDLSRCSTCWSTTRTCSRSSTRRAGRGNHLQPDRAHPHPIFDTQIAMMASQSEQIGYSNLVEAWLGLTIDKARALPTGRAARSPSGRSNMPSAMSPICRRSSRACSSA